MAGEDLYAVLGILPDAEDIVVTAAYRALAMRYHPDRWSGEPTEAHRRMTEINRAHAVLGDKARRAAYEKTCEQSNQGSFNAEGTAGQDEAFASALSQLEDRWQIACSIYPTYPHVAPHELGETTVQVNSVPFAVTPLATSPSLVTW